MVNPYFFGGAYNPNLCFGLYHFDGSTVDSSPSGRLLSLDGAVIWNSGKFGTHSLRVPDDTYDQAFRDTDAYDVGNSDFTFELFFLYDFSFGSQYKGLIANANDASTKDWQLYLNNQKVEFGVNLSTDGWVTLQHQDNAISGDWNYVKVLRKNGVIKIGLNGIESNSSINCGNQSVTTTATSFVVGGMYRSSPYNGFFPNGYIDELRLNKQAVDGWSVPSSAFTE